jgi:hypothetical protein
MALHLHPSVFRDRYPGEAEYFAFHQQATARLVTLCDSDGEREQGDAILLVVELLETWGHDRVSRWVRNIGHCMGRDC